jgi:starvation-inducible DNA-binding protein
MQQTLNENSKAACADAVAKVLADTFVLYLKTHNFHWNVEGPLFRTLHLMFEEQYRDLWAALDELAERVRALGRPAPGTTAQLTALATIRESEGGMAAMEMLHTIINDNETLIGTLRGAISAVQAAGDEASAGLLTDRLLHHEKQVWMMKSIAA